MCAVLGIKNSRDAVARLPGNAKDVVSTDTPGGQQEMLVISQPGVFRLSFSSRRPEAEAFTTWVCHEVLPAIYRQGYYVKASDAPSDDYMLVREWCCRVKRIAPHKDYCSQLGQRAARIGRAKEMVIVSQAGFSAGKCD